MSEVVVTDHVETPEAETPVVEVKTDDAPLGAPGLAALQAERDARAAVEKKLKEFEDRDKTEAERQAERTATLERENAELKSGALRATVAATKGVPAALLSGSTQVELEASADALIAFRGDKTDTTLVVPNEGKNPRPQPDSESAFVASLFSQGD